MNVETPLFFTLSDIASWQLDSMHAKVELPTMQRGFVWKVSQIEALWDSILRGYPIGSFLLSKSADEKLFLLDGQQRATSISLGFHNPWNIQGENNFWSLKKIPTVWIDLNPKEKTPTQKYVIRVVTQSHPWGYQRANNSSILSVADRRMALKNFREIDDNKKLNGYIHFPSIFTYPYDADLPVPLCFLMNSVRTGGNFWKELLLDLIKQNLVKNIKTKYLNGTGDYLSQVEKFLRGSSVENEFYTTVLNLHSFQIPGVIIRREVLQSDDEEEGDDPTLFVRLNSSGTKIAGEELIYSIYKSSFPLAKDLVESIGATFVPPSLVISLVSRLVLSELHNGSYPYSLSVSEFRKRISNGAFKNGLHSMIGNGSGDSPAKILFSRAFDLLLSEHNICTPPVLVKKIVKDSPELFLMLLQWLRLNNRSDIYSVDKRILATITALSWFGKNTPKYVREIWSSISNNDFWSKDIVAMPLHLSREQNMAPMIHPELLREYLVSDVVQKNVLWDNLYPQQNSQIFQSLLKIVQDKATDVNDARNLVNSLWDRFINSLFSCRSLILFVQRQYVNDKFGDYNQMETLEDTNTPWDWDHIYPMSWVYGKWYINPNTKHWTSCIGNLRALSLEENRSENNSLSPKQRLKNVKFQSFIMENDWEYWQLLETRINDDNKKMVKNHLSAIIHRFCNLYQKWYDDLEIGELFTPN